MKKLVSVKLVGNHSDVVFSLENSVGGGNDNKEGAIRRIYHDSYYELMKGKESEGVIAFLTKAEYDSYKKQGKID